jgi:hypothetical protein
MHPAHRGNGFGLFRSCVPRMTHVPLTQLPVTGRSAAVNAPLVA